MSLDGGRWRTVGATVIAAARAEALRTAFCIATDATGVAVQPLRGENRRQPCRRGHYFVLIADRDHIFFAYTPKETSAVVAEMFRGFFGYVPSTAYSAGRELSAKGLRRPRPRDAPLPLNPLSARSGGPA